jgi:hypothetical protein
MRGSRWLAVGVLTLVTGLVSGCRSAGTKSTVISQEPGLTDAAGSDSRVAEGTVQAAPTRTTAFAARHPLFMKPRQYWESSGDNKIVKAAAATFIGVPAGFVGEVKQIIVGAPPEVRY